jgi:hypothetical protein
MYVVPPSGGEPLPDCTTSHPGRHSSYQPLLSEASSNKVRPVLDESLDYIESNYIAVRARGHLRILRTINHKPFSFV